MRDVIFEAILSTSERYQNIQDNPEYNSVLPFKIILKNFAVNMLKCKVFSRTIPLKLLNKVFEKKSDFLVKLIILNNF